MAYNSLYEALNDYRAVSALHPKKSVPGEVEYFRQMMEYFKADKRCCVLEVHQGYVTYTQDGSTPKKCEIADLMIVAYSSKRNCMKVTFLQAKYPRAKQLPNAIKFKLDVKQYHLLKDCPKINPINTHLHRDILRVSSSPSITSYGIFYRDKDTINFGYETTQRLKPMEYDVVVNGGKKSVDCYFETSDDVYDFERWHMDVPFCCVNRFSCHGCRMCHLKSDLLSTVEANTFEYALLNFQIGSPILIHYWRHKEIARSIFDTVNDSARENGTNINNFNAFFSRYAETHNISLDELNNGKDGDTREQKEPEGVPFSVGAILLVDVDGEEPSRREY